MKGEGVRENEQKKEETYVWDVEDYLSSLKIKIDGIREDIELHMSWFWRIWLRHDHHALTECLKKQREKEEEKYTHTQVEMKSNTFGLAVRYL